MSSSVELEVAYRIGNAPMQTFPFPHIYVRDVFPAAFYGELLEHLPPPEQLTPIEQARSIKGYRDRFVQEMSAQKLAGVAEPYRGFWSKLAGWMVGGRFAQLVMQKFGPFIQERFKDRPEAALTDEALLVYDRTNYSLGPHTDMPSKVVAMLFYLPRDERLARYGTSIYVPKDATFTCAGGPHYPFEGFERMVTMPFLPNSMFAFAKTQNSFHGVEPIREQGVGRYLLLYDLREAPAASSASGVKFSG